VEVRILDAVLPVGEEEVARVEHTIGVAIPPEYRTFLFSSNGGFPEPANFPIVDSEGKVIERNVIQSFYGVGTGHTYSDLERKYRMFHDRVPSNLLPIASDPGGNQICICVSGDDFGKIFFWDHEREQEEGVAPTYDNVLFVADGFRAFLASLTD